MKQQRKKYNWIVVNQSIDPTYVRVFEKLTPELGDCLLITGSALGGNLEGITVLKAPEYDKRNILIRVLSWTKFTLFATVKLLFIPGKPFIYCSTNPPVMPFMVYLIHKLKGCSYGLLYFDLYPEIPVRLGWIKENGLSAKIITYLNRKAMLSARLSITLSDKMLEVLKRQLGTDYLRAELAVIPYVVDTNFLKPLNKTENEFISKHILSDRFIVLYSGNLGKTHSVHFIVDLAEKLIDDKNILFLIIGEGFGKKDLEDKLKQNPLSNVKLLPFQPRDFMPYSLASGDVAIIVQAPGTENYSLPSKLYSALSVGSAVFACVNPESDLARIVIDNEIGVVSGWEDPAGMKKTFLKLVSDQDKLKAMQKRARSYAENNNSVDAIVRQYKDKMLPRIKKNPNVPL